ncbi:MAG: methylenetetrahydrofolate reductase [NAD(P)H] [Chitinophagales bacterium]|nr:methylenetetrahydrofolate reductase [NAD(P)H] [Bacteroidota bacterium]MCB9255719.1 methylenetetrahydrofolate reductase [NAD(P)H] [Chitinophagales bacterium]
MKVIEILKESKETLFSIEILPPMKGKNINDLYRVIDPLMEFKPPFIDVTYHREEIIYKKNTDGSLREVPLRKRPGTVGICAALMNKYKVEAVPHLICGGFTKEETEDALFSLYYLGIENVLVIKGDEIGKSEYHIEDRVNRNVYAVDLVDQIRKMNKGNFLHEETKSDFHTNFCVGVAGYPEKHFEAPNLNSDLRYLKAKVEAGADYIVTQMFFDNSKFFAFVDKCRAAGINVPIIPGIKPIATLSHLNILPSMFHIDIPEDLEKAMSSCKNNNDVKQVGIEWAIAQSKELKAANVPCIHYYTMSRSENTAAIAREVF